MSTILIRCSVHAALSHEAFSDWLERRRCDLACSAAGVDDIEARRLGHQDLVIELHCEPGVAHDCGQPGAVRDFVADLTLLGMNPMVYVSAPSR